MDFRILNMIVTSGFLTAIECTKLVFGLGSVPEPAGEFTALPQTLAGLRGPTSKGKGGETREGSAGDGKEGMIWEGRKRKKEAEGGNGPPNANS